MTDSDRRTKDTAADASPAPLRAPPENEGRGAGTSGVATPLATGPFPARLRADEGAKRSAERPTWWTGYLRGSFR
jgi:hypothetical protein